MSTNTLRTLRLIVLDDNDTDNLFVRLPEHVASELKVDEFNDFIPLMITVANQVIYTSWNGGLAETLNNEESCIHVPRCILSGMASFPTTVQVQSISHIPNCRRVHVEPLNPKDWELLESHAESLESGLLLRQISVVYGGQSVVLRIQRDQIEIVVMQILFQDDRDISLPFSSMEQTSTFGLLLQDTELIISPKLREATDIVDWSEPQRLMPSQDDWNHAMLDLHVLVNAPTFSVSLACVLVHESLWNQRYEWALLAPDDDNLEQANKRLVQVISHSLIPKGQAVLHPLVRLDLELALYFSSIRLRPTSAPEYLDMDSIVLRHIQIDKDHSPSSYLIPSLEPSPMVKIRPPIHDEYLTLPLNSVIPSSWLTNGEKEEASTRLLRIEGKEDYVDSSIALSSILVFDHADRINLFQNYGQNNGDPQVLLQPKMDYMANTLNDSVVSSIDWTENILLDLQRNPSIMISICGETGSGKTYSALLLCALARLKYQKATLYLDCKQLQESTSSIGEILSQFDTVFELACDSQDCIIIMENLDRLAPNLLGSDDSDSAGRVQSANPIAVSQSKVIADRILQLIEATVIQESIILSLVITCPEVDSIHPSLHQLTPIFQRQMTVPVLCAKERLSVLKQMMGRLSLPQSDSFEEITLRHLTESFRPRDLEKISFRVSQLLRASTKLTLEEILSSVLEDYTPVSHLSLKQKNKKRLVQPSWSNIGGLHQVKSSLEETMLYPTRYRLIYEQATVRLPRGVLLFGPPGCGKSTLVPALAQLCSMPLVSCKGPEILDKYIGASEAKVRELFQRASSVAPSILFLDELDALSPRRGSDHTGVTDRVVNQLLTFLDGVEESSGRVYVVGASSRPDKIDPALLRPGRLEQHFYVGPPKSYEELYDVFCKVAQGWNLSEECQVLVNSQEEAGSAFLTSIVMDGSSRFSPADMKAALDTAHVTAVHRTLELAKPEDISKVEIYKEDLIAALKITRPSLNVDESRVLEQVYKSFKRVKGLTSQGQNQNLKTTLR